VAVEGDRMLIAVARGEHLPEWLYPHRVAPLSGEALRGVKLRDVDSVHLWLAIEPTAAESDAFGDPADANCDVGFEHNAIESLQRLSGRLVTALATMPDSDRWRVAQEWTKRRLSRRPTKEDQARDKSLLKTLSEFAARSVENGWLIVNVEED
jgi:hypothetical protein